MKEQPCEGRPCEEQALVIGLAAFDDTHLSKNGELSLTACIENDCAESLSHSPAMDGATPADPKNSVIVRMTGGLGNQLFQYATARAHAFRHNRPLILDIRPLTNCSLRDYDLHHFAIQGTIGTEQTLPPGRDNKLRYGLWRLSSDARSRLLREASIGSKVDLSSAAANVILHGYWQTEQHFAEFANIIRADLQVKTKPSVENEHLLSQIATTTAVSVHIRRGDYVASQKNQSVFASCSLDYYQRAAEHIIQQVSTPVHFYVFSDDPDWVQAEITLPSSMTLVRHNCGKTAYEDLRLMHHCDHHIIANSTFSWWGAWLNPAPEKIVVAPNQWFHGEANNRQQIVPNTWHTISN